VRRSRCKAGQPRCRAWLASDPLEGGLVRFWNPAFVSDGRLTSSWVAKMDPGGPVLIAANSMALFVDTNDRGQQGLAIVERIFPSTPPTVTRPEPQPQPHSCPTTIRLRRALLVRAYRNGRATVRRRDSSTAFRSGLCCRRHSRLRGFESTSPIFFQSSDSWKGRSATHPARILVYRIRRTS
jgi:hypothetical protein